MKTVEKEIEGMKFKLRRITEKEDREVKQKVGFITEIGEKKSAKLDFPLYQTLITIASIVEPEEYRKLEEFEKLDAVVANQLKVASAKLNEISEETKKE